MWQNRNLSTGSGSRWQQTWEAMLHVCSFETKFLNMVAASVKRSEHLKKKSPLKGERRAAWEDKIRHSTDKFKAKTRWQKRLCFSFSCPCYKCHLLVLTSTTTNSWQVGMIASKCPIRRELPVFLNNLFLLRFGLTMAVLCNSSKMQTNWTSNTEFLSCWKTGGSFRASLCLWLVL